MDEFAATESIWLPMLKSRDGDDAGSVYRHRGVASTEEQDQQAETVLQRGIDFSYFLAKGFFNWNHRPGPENLIGEPTDARVTELGAIPDYPLGAQQKAETPCLYVEGVLYKGMPMAEHVWGLLQTLGKGGYRRRLGYSVEGGIAHKAPGGLLARTIVRDCAITNCAINASAWASLGKSFGGAVGSLPSDVPHASYESLTDWQRARAGAETVARDDAGAGAEVEALVKAMLGLTPCAAGCNDGERFGRGRAGMLDHLVRCEGWQPDRALAHVLRICETVGLASSSTSQARSTTQARRSVA